MPHLPTSNEQRRDFSASANRAGLLKIAWSRKSALCLGMVLALVLGAVYYLVATPVYQSKAQILVVKKRPDSFTGLDTRNLPIEDFVATHKTLMESPTIIEGALQHGNLSELASFTGKDDPLDLIQKSLIVTRNRSTGISNNVLDISFRATDPADSVLALNAIIASYKDYLDVTYRNISDDTFKLIMEARKVLEEDLKKQDAAYRAFRQTAPVLLSRGKEGASLAQERLSSIEAKRSALLVRKAEIQGYLQAIDAGIQGDASQESLLALISGWSIKLEGDQSGPSDRKTVNNQLFTLLQEEQKLLETRGESHIEVKALRQRIAIARDYLASPAAAWRKPMPKDASKDEARNSVELFREYFTQQLNHVEISAKLLNDLHMEQFAAARALANFEVEDDKYRRDIAFTEKLLDSAMKKLEDANLVKNVGGYEAKTITPATLGKKVFPSGLIVLAASLLAGAVLGFGLAYLAEYRDKRFRDVDEIRARLGLPLVGQIPFVKLPLENGGKSTATAGALAPVLFSHHQPHSACAEAYRSVRTALYFSIHGQGHKVVQVTSANAGDGKSTMAANLAISIAQSGKKVLLLDADMRKPAIHKLFGLPAQEGLSSLIVNNAEPDDVLQEAPIPGLWVLPAGPTPPNPAELLTAPRFKELLNYVREQFDFVIVDSPALLAVTDASVVAHLVDGVFLSLRLTKNGRPDAERARNILLNLKANIIGVVVNASESSLSAPSDGGYDFAMPKEQIARAGQAAIDAHAKV